MAEVWEDSTEDNINLKVYRENFRRPFDEPEGPITWHQNIRGLFTENNARCMISKNINLSSYDSVKDNAKPIYIKLSRKEMPPGDPWSDYQIGLFKRWMDGDGHGENKCLLGDVPSATDYSKKIRDAPLRYQFPETLPDDFIPTFYQNIKPLFTVCDQKFGKEDYQVDIMDYEQVRNQAKKHVQGDKNKNIINDIVNNVFPTGSQWPSTWKNVLNRWIKYDCKIGEVPIGQESL
ncbi:10761_t:CDS:1 [Funneliformis geosporum]|uniref:10882_t:CDS:1 n=1 Tax=Funneliformis geosporum TaxID=1117311 RepID=A0A9W4WXP8_9GLOM|nr:10761_t:CDS:1 [Funneliformis geosporum]CAI2194234.1 10882_t:CDS:1 [Funneliformis geosporum]